MTLELQGGLTPNGNLNVDDVKFAGTTQTIPAYSYPNRVTVTGTASLGGDVTVGKTLELTDFGTDLKVNGKNLTLTDSLFVINSATFTMDNAADTVVTRHARFLGGSSTMSAGLIQVSGNFTTQSSAFTPSGTHKVELNGATGSTQVVDFSGATSSFFNNLTAAGPATVTLKGSTFARTYIVKGDFVLAAATTINDDGTATVTLELQKSATLNGTLSVDDVEFAGTSQTIPAYSYPNNVTVTGTASLGGNVSVGKALTISGFQKDLNINGKTLTVTDSLYTTSSGTLTMLAATDTVKVKHMRLQGGSTSGLLTSGVMRVTGNITTSSTSFAPSGTHKVVLEGTSDQTLDSSSSFHNLEIATTSPVRLSANVDVNGTFTSSVSGDSIVGNGRTFTVDNVSVNGLALDHVLFVVERNGTSIAFDNVNFRNYSVTVTQFTVKRASGALTFTGLNFFTTPTTGKYVRAEDTDFIAPFLSVTMKTATPVDGSGFQSTSGGATISWVP